MKILIICSKAFYKYIEKIKDELEKYGHIVHLPNSYDYPEMEEETWKKGVLEHAKFKKDMFKMSRDRIKEMDAVLCLNFTKNGIDNYIGGATFLELYEAFMEGKKIYLYNDIPNGMLYDEISGFNPIIIKGDLELIK